MLRKGVAMMRQATVFEFETEPEQSAVQEFDEPETPQEVIAQIQRRTLAALDNRGGQADV